MIQRSVSIFFLMIAISLHSKALTCEESLEGFVDWYMGPNWCGFPPTCSGGANTSATKFLSAAVNNLGTPVLRIQCFQTHCNSGQTAVSTVEWATCSPNLPGVKAKASSMICPAKKTNSIVSLDARSIGESIPITGAPFELMYFSHWVPGKASEYKFNIVLADSVPRQGIDSFIVEIASGGIVLQTTPLSNLPNTEFNYQWDGLDQNGNPVMGSKKFDVKVTEVRGTKQFHIRSTALLGTLNSVHLGVGGWLPSIYAFYDHTAGAVLKGNGDSYTAVAKSYGTGRVYVPELDGSVVYIFDMSGRLVETKTGFLGANVYDFSYDNNGRLDTIYDAHGRFYSFVRDSSGNLTSIVTYGEHHTTTSVDSDGYLNSVSDPAYQTYVMYYNGAGGLLNYFYKPNGSANYFNYTTDGDLIDDVHSGGYSLTLASLLTTSEIARVQLTTPMGRATTVDVKGAGTKVIRSTTEPSGVSTSFQFVDDSSGKYVRNVSPGVIEYTSLSDDPRFGSAVKVPSNYNIQDGPVNVNVSKSVSSTLSNSADPFSITSYTVNHQIGNYSINSTFNPSTKVITAQTGLGVIETSKLDYHERVIEIKNGNMEPTEFGYTGPNLTSVTSGSRQTLYTYDQFTNFLYAITNSYWQSIGFLRDAAGRIVWISLPDARMIQIHRNLSGDVTGISPPDRPIHEFVLNSQELLSDYRPPTLSSVPLTSTSYSYNSDKQLTHISRPDGRYINYSYNSNSGVLTGFDTSTANYEVTMDATLKTAPSQIRKIGGDRIRVYYSGTYPVSVLTTTDNYQDRGSYTRTISNIGLKRADTSATVTANYTYDNDRRLTSVEGLSYTYNTPNGQLTGSQIGSGSSLVSETYAYNNHGEPTDYEVKVGTSSVYKVSYDYDNVGRITEKTETADSITDEFTYSYDLAGRLSDVYEYGNLVQQYGYDSNSNRNAGFVDAQGTNASYDDQDRLTAYNVLTFTYNANGDLTSQTNFLVNMTTSYNYDEFGTLLSVSLPWGPVIEYEVDPLGRRIGKKVDGVLQKRWAYDTENRIVAEFGGLVTTPKRFIYGSKSNIPDLMIIGSEKYRIVSDHLGSPRLVIKVSDGSIVQKMKHDVFGRHQVDTNPGFIPFGFAGGLFDNDTYLVRFGARDYDAETGRWTSKDPIILNGGDTNLFGYVSNDPVNWIDTDGMSRASTVFNTLEGAGGAGAVGGSISTADIVKAVLGTLVNVFNDRKLSEWEIKKLEEAGYDVHKIKKNLGKGRADLFKRPNGDICVRPKDGKGPGEDLQININDILGEK